MLKSDDNHHQDNSMAAAAAAAEVEVEVEASKYIIDSITRAKY